MVKSGSLDDFFEGKNWREIILAIKVIFGIEGAKNVQSCMQAKIILNRGSKMNFLKNATKYVELGLTALGAMEEDFECSGMCEAATYYSFSDASKGVPETGCKA